MASALLISTERPWPRDAGVRQRLRATLEGLSEVADVDLLSVVAAPAPPPVDDLPARDLRIVQRPPGYELARAPAWIAGRLPRTVALVDWQAPRRVLAAQGSYDLAWYLGPHTRLALGAADARCTVVDVDDVPQRLLRHKLRARAGPPVQRLADRIDARRWERLLPSLLDGADAVAVCSELDRLELGDAVVVPNGYDAPTTPVQRMRRDHPVLVSVGGSDYLPNDDAHDFVARRVLPLVRARLPRAELWVVGAVAPRSATSRLEGLPGVRLLGRVAAMTPVLAEVDVSLVCVRWGGGTRIKALEAFAHDVPVVGTPVGLEGLDVRNDQHVLIASTPRGLADACVRVLADQRLRDGLVHDAARLRRERYSVQHTRDAVRRVARQLGIGS